MVTNNHSKKEQPEIHSNEQNDIGSPLNTTGKHGADHQVKGNDDGLDMQPGQPKADHDATKTDISKTDDSGDSQSYDGNQDPDANKTPYK